MYKKALALLSAFVIITGCNGLSLTTYASELTCKSEGIYYLDDSGKIQTGWQTINGNTYYFKNDGTAVTKSCVINGVRYKFSSDGICQGEYTGWTKSSIGKRYYKNGIMITNQWLKTKSGKRYYAAEDGYMTTGWYKAEDGWCYFNEETGLMSTGDVDINGHTYSFSSKGIWDCTADYDNTKIYTTLKQKLSKADYGGIYFDDNVVIVMSKNNEKIVKITEELKKLYAPIVVKECDFSINELEKVKADLENNMKKYGISTISTDVENNRIYIEMKERNSKLNTYLQTLDDNKIVYIDYTEVVMIDD